MAAGVDTYQCITILKHTWFSCAGLDKISILCSTCMFVLVPFNLAKLIKAVQFLYVSKYQRPVYIDTVQAVSNHSRGYQVYQLFLLQGWILILLLVCIVLNSMGTFFFGEIWRCFKIVMLRWNFKKLLKRKTLEKRKLGSP